MGEIHLARPQDLEHERQPVGDELLGVLLLLNAGELLQQALYQRPAVLQEAGAQGLHPGVQGPGHACMHTAHAAVTLTPFQNILLHHHGFPKF